EGAEDGRRVEAARVGRDLARGVEDDERVVIDAREVAAGAPVEVEDGGLPVVGDEAAGDEALHEGVRARERQRVARGDVGAGGAASARAPRVARRPPSSRSAAIPRATGSARRGSARFTPRSSWARPRRREPFGSTSG